MNLDSLGPKIIQKAVSFSAATNNVVIAGVVGKLFKVVQIFLALDANANLIFKSGTTAISGTIPMLANGSVTLDFPQPLTGVALDDGFIITSDSTANVGGTVWYILS